LTTRHQLSLIATLAIAVAGIILNVCTMMKLAPVATRLGIYVLLGYAFFFFVLFVQVSVLIDCMKELTRIRRRL
jgi:predicted membrane channel-forming protein YqfA (hemolysin III family)